MKRFILIFLFAARPFDFASIKIESPENEINIYHPRVAAWSDKIIKYSGKHYRITASIMDKESRGKIYAIGKMIPVYNRFGNFDGYDRARCLMQVVRYYHSDKINGRNLYDPDVCINVAVEILKKCGIDKSYRRALECYNPGADESYYEEILKR